MRLRPLLAAGLALVACGKEPTVVPVRNLERPADMTFLCMQMMSVDNQMRLSGRPMGECHPHLDERLPQRSEVVDTKVVPRNYGTFGLVSQTARGELGVIDIDANRLLDLDPGQPGYNMLPVGAFPEVMAASQDGCIVATANRGSCDLAVIDPQRLTAAAFGATTIPVTGNGPIATRVVPTTASGRPLRVAPHEISFLPQTPNSLYQFPAPPPDMPTVKPPPVAPPACQAGGAYDLAHPMDRAPWRAVVTFPSCDLVAVLELPSGKIVSSVYVRSNGVVDAGTEPVCPEDCGIGVVPQPGPDAAAAAPDAMVSLPPDAATSVPDAAVVPDTAPAADAAAAVAEDAAMSGMPAPADAASGAPPAAIDAGAPRIPGASARTSALAIRPDGTRLYVGGTNDVYITALELKDGALQPVAGGGRIPLHDGPGGIRRLRLSFDPYTVTPTSFGRFMGVSADDRQYLYAFAVDDSIRVLDANPRSNKFERECDVNVDPQFIPPDDPQNAGGGGVPDCYALFDDPAHPPARRRAFARGPGLRIPNIGNADQPPPVPQDIGFGAQRDLPAGFAYPSIVGDFGYVVASDGTVYILNIDSRGNPRPPDNSFRDFNAGPTGTNGGPQVLASPARNFGLADVPLPSRVPLDTNFQGARVEGMFISPLTPNQLSWVTFPDPRAANSQSWFLTWEGAVASSTRTHGSVLPANPANPDAPAGSVVDQGQEFCQQGVLPKDVVLLNGCVKDTDCATDGSLACRQALPGTPGLCFPVTLPKDSDLITRCTRQLTTRRRYEVRSSTPRRLDLALKVDELPFPSLARCDNDDDCTKPPYGAVFGSGKQSNADGGAGSDAGAGADQPGGYSCKAVRPDEPKRCVKLCATAGTKDDTKCRAGTVCEDVDGSMIGPVCVEGAPIDPACWPSGTAFEVQAGQSFLVNGDLAPHPSTARVDESQTGVPESERRCVADTGRNPLLVNRIPFDAPHCSNVADYQVKLSEPEKGFMDGNVVPVNPDNSRNALKSTVPAGPPGTWGNPCLFWGINDDDTVCTPRPMAVTENGKVVSRTLPPAACNCELQPNGDPDPKNWRRPPTCHVKALFQNAQVRFVVTNLEQFAGDANISRFDVAGGFRPDFVSTRDDILVTMGVRVVTGPLLTPEFATVTPNGNRVHYLYLLDQGRTGSSTAGRGQVLRINPRYGTYGTAWFDSNYSPYPFQIQ